MKYINKLYQIKFNMFSGSTCCELSTPGQYGCCPLPSATCCSDNVHCCPQGYTCDVADGRCNQGLLSVPFFTKTAAVKTEKKKVEDVVCPDGASQCPDGDFYD